MYHALSQALLSLILPVQNQADHISRILVSYIETLDEMIESFELIPVVNASTDESEKIIRAMAEQDERIRPQVTPERGWGRAVRLGLEAARGEVLCYTNAARTQADELAVVIRHYLEHPDCVVKATRGARASFSRRLGSQLFNSECRLLFGLTVRDLNGTPKVFARRYREPFALKDDGDLLDLELLIRCQEHGVPVLEVPITSTQRHGGLSSTKLATAYGLLSGAVRVWQEEIRKNA